MFKVKRLADMAILLALGVLANAFSYSFGIIGRLSLVYTVAYISGIFLGPFGGLLITWLADLLPALIMPQGPYMPLIGLGTAMISLIVGLCNRYLPYKFHTRLIIGAILSYLFCTCGITALGEVPLFIAKIYPYSLARSIGVFLDIDSPYLQLALAKMVTQPIWILINLAITISLCYRLSKIIDNRYGGVINRTRDKLKEPLPETEISTL